MQNIRLTLGHNEAILKIVAGGLGMSYISKLAIEPLSEKVNSVILDTPILATYPPSLYASAPPKISRSGP